MGYTGKLEEKFLAQKLRHSGYSYSEILRKVHVSKDTLSRWCKDIQLSKKQKQKLINKKLYGQKKGSLIAADNKRRLRIKKTYEIFTKSRKEVGIFNTRDKFIAGIGLYAAEGDKTDRQVGFTNADPALIKFMMNWFRKYCRIPEDKFRGAIWIHEGLNEKRAKQFWSSTTSIPLTQFHKTYIAKNKPESKKIRKNIHAYGVFGINVSSSEIHRRIMGWIYALFNGKIPLVH